MSILITHGSILSQFDQYILAQKELLKSMKPYTHDPGVQSLETLVKDRLKTDCGKQMYIAETCAIVNEYKMVLKTPILFGTVSDRKHELEMQFDQISKQVCRKMGFSYEIKFPQKPTECLVCHNVDPTLFETDDIGKKTCISCSSEMPTLETGNTSLDYNRATITGKFIYNRILHFQDCIKQYQGKQNCKIHKDVFSDLEKKFAEYGLLEESSNPLIRYSKVTREHIKLFLKQLKYVKHYENVNVIYSTLTDKRVEDIGHLEQLLLDDFKEFVVLYDSLHNKDRPEELDRKNFLNVQYLLFQLLRRHGHKSKMAPVLKTTDRKLFHDKICRNLFQQLGWNFTPVF